MAKTSYQEIPPEFDSDYHNPMVSGDRYTYPHVRVNRLFTSRKRRKGITQRSLMVIYKDTWAAFDTTLKDAWNLAGSKCNLTGWKLFIKDTAARLANDLTGFGTPNIYHQCFVGHLHVESPATTMIIAQFHPASYYVSKKVRGTRSQFEPVVVYEQMTMPMQIGITYRSDLTTIDSDYFAGFFVVIEHNYQGRDIETVAMIPFDLSSDWNAYTATIDHVIGYIRGYTAYLVMNNVRGDVWVDNFDVNHGGHNWARDPECNDINQGYTRAFYQVAKHWIALDISEGCYFESEYYNG